jgi:hypothetical protein
MMDPSVHHATGRLQATSDLPCDDDDTVVTPNRGESSKSTVKSSVEITLRFRFVPSQNNDNIHPAIVMILACNVPYCYERKTNIM